MSEQIYSDMMHFLGSQSKGSQKMERGSLNAQKHTSGEAPKVCSVFGVQYYLVVAHVAAVSAEAAAGAVCAAAAVPRCAVR